MKNHFLRITSIILLMFISLILAMLCPFMIGLLISKYLNIPDNIASTVPIIINIIFIIYSVICMIISNIIEKKFAKKKPSDIFNELVDIKKLNTQTELIQKHLINNYKKAYICAIIYYCLISICLVSNGLNYKFYANINTMLDVQPLYFISILIAIILIFPFLFVVLVYLYSRILKKAQISTSQDLYPNLSKLIKDEFEKEGIKKEIIINITIECNVGIYEVKDQIHINICDFILKFLTDDEIKAILYHEIAHYKNKDTLKAAQAYKYANRLDYLLPKNTFYFCFPFASKTILESEELKQATNILFEYKADDLVLEKGLASSYSNAVFKIFGLNLALLNASFLEYRVYLNNKLEINEELFNIKLNSIKTYYYKHLDFITYSSKNYLSPVIVTHPTVKERLEKFSTGNNINKELASNTKYDLDINNYIKEENKEFQNNPNAIEGLKKEKRYFEETYLKGKNKIIENNFNENINELSAIAQDAIDFTDLDFAKEILGKILEQDPNNLLAKYYLGLVLFKHDLDSSCLQYLKDVEKDNSSLGTEAHALLLEYYTYMGMKEEKEELKKHTFQKIDDAYNNNLQFNFGEKLLPYENQEVTQNIIEIAKECNDISHIIIGTKKKKDIEMHIVIIYLKLKKTEEETWQKTINKMAAYLNTVSTNFRLYPFYFQIIHNRYRKKVFHIYDAKKDNK